MKSFFMRPMLFVSFFTVSLGIFDNTAEAAISERQVISCARQLVKKQINGLHSVEFADMVLEKMVLAGGNKEKLKESLSFCQNFLKNYQSYYPIYRKKDLLKHLRQGNHNVKDPKRVRAVAYLVSPRDGLRCYKQGLQLSAAAGVAAGVRGFKLLCETAAGQKVKGFAFGASVGLGLGASAYFESQTSNADYMPVGLDFNLRLAYAVGRGVSVSINPQTVRGEYRGGAGVGYGHILELAPTLDIFIRTPIVFSSKRAQDLAVQAYGLN
jgi:hypothetical protein